MLLTIFSTFMLSFAPPKDSTIKKPQVNSAVNKTRMLRLINEIRSKGAKCGDTWYNPAPPLTWNDQLEQAAQVHSNDMHARKYFNHVNPEGENAGERIDRVGYSWKAFGENIGMGYRDELEVVSAWKSSPGHCKNLLNPKYKEMGVARAGMYWTQNFGTK